jgi:hypothetical protein
MDKHEKTIKLLESFLSDKEVDGVCGYMVDSDDKNSIQVIVILDIDYIQEANTKPGFVARMIREGVRQEIKKWLGLDVYVGSIAKKCDDKVVTESLSTHFRRRLSSDTLMDELNNIIDYDLNPLQFKDKMEYVSEVCDLLKDQAIDYIWETEKIKSTPKQKDQVYHYFVNRFFNHIIERYNETHKKYKDKKMNESKKKYVVTKQQYDLIKEYFDPLHYLKNIMSDAPKYIKDPSNLKYEVAFQKVVDVIFKYTMKHSPVDNLKGLEVSKVTPQGWGGNMDDDSKGSHTEWTVVAHSILPKWFNPNDDNYKSQMEKFKTEFKSIAEMMGLSSSSPLSKEGFPFDKVRFQIYND